MFMWASVGLLYKDGVSKRYVWWFCGLLEKEKDVNLSVIIGVRGEKPNRQNWEVEITIKHGYDHVCKPKGNYISLKVRQQSYLNNYK